MLAPEVAAVLGAVPFTHMTDEVVAGMRAGAAAYPATPSDAVDVDERIVPGDPPVTLRVSRPRGVAGPARRLAGGCGPCPTLHSHR